MRETIKKFLPERVKYNYRNFRKYRKKQQLEREYAGNEVTCNICDHQYRIFEPFKNVPNEKCTNCGSMKRHRLLFQYLNGETELFREKKEKLKLLHFAPEKAFYDIFSKRPDIEYFPCDIDPGMYKFNRNTQIYEIDITSIDFKSETFDIILCNHVLEHIIDDKKAMTELFRVMKKSGWGIFQVPIAFNREKTYEDFSKITPEERYAAFGQIDHVRWYGLDYPRRLESAGFKVHDIKYTHEFTEEEKFRFGFPEKESIYFCSKSS
ncbi:class I SAM-dependent methyltransferase [Salinimicrobium sediminilitoris]|uniref:class I SAM-dependent methyltransferase n=1 Tax=Salinimicrobium sediminilitoris TaxID=2876715 RepID=UPI001E3227D3|nr:class I SAM-dependent methyltransferase [Salinimicrobium sediminilitoris]MCC8358520.1 class I SAM-dependent methyltransferase [Salinimicrobium sediminilitoris]